MSADISLALNQVDRVAGLCTFLESPQVQKMRESYPVSMPADIGSSGFDTPLWLGFGIVGLWAAMDAYAERAQLAKKKCSRCQQKCGIARFTMSGKLATNLVVACHELDDMRHLFAHNFAGRADAEYFGLKPRHVFAQGAHATLSSGAQFDGVFLSLGIPHLRYYADQSRKVLRDYL